MAAEIIRQTPVWEVDGLRLFDPDRRAVALGVGQGAVEAPLEVAWIHMKFENIDQFRAPLPYLVAHSITNPETYDSSFLVTPVQWRSIRDAEMRAPAMSADVLRVTKLFFSMSGGLDRLVRFDRETEAAIAQYASDRLDAGKPMPENEERLYRVQLFFRRNWLWNLQQGKRGELKLRTRRDR